MSERGITVVVPTIEREAYLLGTIHDLLAQKHRPLEILIVDQSEHPTRSFLALVESQKELLTYHRVSFRGSAKARNYGWQNARYDVLVFVDDDIRCGPDFLTQHLRALLIPGVGLVAGGFDTGRPNPDNGPPTGAFITWTATPKLGFGSRGEFDIDHVPEGNFSAWRHVLHRVHGIDEAFDVPAALYEGIDLALRVKKAGFRIRFNGRARVLHLAAPWGGNRVFDTTSYIWGLAHNRALLIRRYLRWYQMPTALLRLGALGLSYALRHKNAAVLIALLHGCSAGLHLPQAPRPALHANRPGRGTTDFVERPKLSTVALHPQFKRHDARFQKQ